MAEPLTCLQERLGESWLIGIDSQQLAALTEKRLQDLCQFQQTQPTILLAELDPLSFLASFLAACIVNCPLFLCNPHWTEAELQQVIRTVQPNLIIGDCFLNLPNLPSPASTPTAKPGWIMIPTGGSSGQIRFAIHTWATLTASVEGFRQYFQVDRVNACCVLPLYHVSGLMQFLRAFTSGGKLAVWPFKTLDTEIDKIEPAEFFLSLVPTQLQRLLQNSWLSRFHTVLLGGAPPWPELLETARKHQIRLAPTYGMTETASQIATLKPDDFLTGQRGCGQLLPHAQIAVYDQARNLLSAGQIGTLTVGAASLALGYYPNLFTDSNGFQTDDLGYLDHQGYLHVVGRSSHKIITGGENVFPIEVEAAIRDSQLVADVCVLGLPDPEWGEAVTAVYVPAFSEVSIAALQAAIETRLNKFKRPKRWVAIETLPRNAQGKVNYEQIRQIL